MMEVHGTGEKEFLEKISKIDDRIKIYEKGNEGLAKGRDYAISKATTQYILPLDSDDLIIDTYIESAYWSLRTNKDAAWTYSNSVGFGIYKYLWNVKFDSNIMKKENILTATALIRKDKILELNGYGVAKRYVNEDWHLWLRMLQKGYFPIQMNFYGFWYRRCGTSLLTDINNKKNKENELRLRDIKEEADKIKNEVQAKIYPIQGNIIPKKDLDWENKAFKKELKKYRILYILPWIKFNNEYYKKIVNLEHKDYDITIITLQSSKYIDRQRIEEYASVFDLTTFIDQEYWLSFIKYIIETRRINKVCIADDVIYKKEILNEINENFPEFNIEEFEYKQDEIAMKKEIDKFKKSKKIHNRVIRKIKRIFKKN